MRNPQPVFELLAFLVGVAIAAAVLMAAQLPRGSRGSAGDTSTTTAPLALDLEAMTEDAAPPGPEEDAEAAGASAPYPAPPPAPEAVSRAVSEVVEVAQDACANARGPTPDLRELPPNGVPDLGVAAEMATPALDDPTASPSSVTSPLPDPDPHVGGLEERVGELPALDVVTDQRSERERIRALGELPVIWPRRAAPGELVVLDRESLEPVALCDRWLVAAQYDVVLCGRSLSRGSLEGQLERARQRFFPSLAGGDLEAVSLFDATRFRRLDDAVRRACAARGYSLAEVARVRVGVRDDTYEVLELVPGAPAERGAKEDER